MQPLLPPAMRAIVEMRLVIHSQVRGDTGNVVAPARKNRTDNRVVARFLTSFSGVGCICRHESLMLSSFYLILSFVDRPEGTVQDVVTRTVLNSKANRIERCILPRQHHAVSNQAHAIPNCLLCGQPGKLGQVVALG